MPKIGFDQITVQIEIGKKKCHYKIYFVRNNQKYYVDYSDDVDKFKTLIKSVIDAGAVRINYEYRKEN